jgi:hypothetical protein
MHTGYLAQLSASTGYLKRSDDNDSEGTWLFDDETALAGLVDRPGPDRHRVGVLQFAVDHGLGHQQRHLPHPVQRR